MAERWLLTGGTGQVGTALSRLDLPEVEIFAPPREELDLSALPLDLAPLFEGVTAIISCGAYTAVDKAESEPDLACSINASAPMRLATVAAERAIPIIHVSTDYVFPADETGPWSENDATGPASIYGMSKLAGEEAIRSSGARHAIVRTAWVVSADGHNFVKTMLRVGAQNPAVRVVADQRGTPTHAGDLAAALAAIAWDFANNPQRASGTWHCTNQGETSWHGLAVHVFKRAAELGFKTPETVDAITTAEYPTPARRPRDSRLDCAQIEKDFGLKLRPWAIAVDEIVSDLAREMKKL